MSEIKPTPIKTWFASNLLTIVAMSLTLIAGAIYLKADVKANAQEIIELKEIVAEYPSEKYFDLKFKVFEDAINENKDDIKELQRIK